MELSIGKGINEFIFGLTENEVIALQGQPDKKYTDDFDDVYLLYNSLETSFKFEKENDYKLGWIETSNKNVKLLEFSPWEILQEELISKLTKILSETPETEDYGSFESVTFNKSWLELQFEYGKLIHIYFGVLFDERDNTL